MKWRARLVVFAVWTAVAALVAIPSARAALSHPTVVPVILGLAVAIYGIPFVAFRCPHCGARQIRGRWDWLLLSDDCWKCHQALDGPPVPTGVLDEKLVAEVNPALAAEMRKDRLATEELAQRALRDPAAAEQLQRQLEERVERLSHWIDVVRAEAPSIEGRAREELKNAQYELTQWKERRRLNP